MKLLSIIIPSYNSEQWLAGCLDSLLLDRDEELDVIVVNDGSKDSTSKIAHEYSEKYPFIRVVDKENGGHGSAINVGLSVAKGLFFKVLDSDDKLEKEGLLHLLDTIKVHNGENNIPDIYLSDYTSVSFEGKKLYTTSLKRNAGNKKNLDKVLPFKKFKKIRFDKYFMLHMLFMRTEMLKENNMKLLEKTFYEDNELVLFSILHTTSFCYLSKPIYLYTVGREGQSISFESMDKNWASQYRVMNKTLEMVSYDNYLKLDKHRRKHAFHCLYIISYLFFFYTHIRMNDEKRKAYKDTMKNFKVTNPKLYRKLKYRTMFFLTWIVPSFISEKITTKAYYSFSKRKGWR